MKTRDNLQVQWPGIEWNDVQHDFTQAFRPPLALAHLGQSVLRYDRPGIDGLVNKKCGFPQL